MPYNYSQINMSSDKLQAQDSPSSVSIMSKISKILANSKICKAKQEEEGNPAVTPKTLLNATLSALKLSVATSVDADL
jgi:hypothetical protein